MPPRVYFVPGIVLLFCAFILSLLVAISLPNLPTLDIVRCRFTTTLDALPYLLSDTSFGVWGERACGSFIDGADSKTGGFAQIIRLPGKFSFVSIKLEPGRLAAGTGYSFTFSSESDDPAIVGPSPTRGLVAHPVATVVTFIALLSSLSFHATIALFASLLSFIAGLVTLTAFVFDIALIINVRDKARQARQGLPDPRIRGVVMIGPGLWITLASLILLFMATCTVWLGRRRPRMAGATNNLPPDSEKSGFFARFRRS